MAGNDPSTFQPTGLYFPSPGCWQLSARAGRTSLAFTTEVQARVP
jgi:hypothetical protein